MARPRADLSQIFREILWSVDERYAEGHCYYRKPSKSMNYPCILYNISSEYNRHADNVKYLNVNRYMVTVIDTDSDSLLKEKVGELSMCTFEREYEVDNLNHFVFVLYF